MCKFKFMLRMSLWKYVFDNIWIVKVLLKINCLDEIFNKKNKKGFFGI